MTDDAKQLFVADRVQALAAVELTRRHHLTVKETKQGAGLDLHVYIGREDKVCVLLFTMRNERAYFAWLAEPVLASGAPKLAHRTKTECVELTVELLDQVVGWYDAVETVLIA